MPVVAIVGAGFSGAATAIQLLTRHGDKATTVVLINRHPNLARGVAYGTQSPAHLLNVPAGRMGLFPERETDFLEFAREQDAAIGAGSFVPRSLYGRYLGARLEQAAAQATRMRLDSRTAEVVDIDVGADGSAARLRFADGGTFAADHVVLAVGNYPPADPAVPDPEFYRSPHYIRDPWAPGVFNDLPAHAPLLLIGSGLTMLDVALDLTHRGHTGTLHALSRRGLLPQVHRQLPAMPVNAPPTGLLEGAATARRYLQLVRRYVNDMHARGVDWRDVIGALRPITPRLWHALSLTERKRFLRHLQVYWDTHRHRTAPASGAELEGLIARSTLKVYAGRLRRLSARAGAAAVTWQPRGETAERQLTVAAVINCTGPQGDITRLTDPLIRALLAKGLISPDPLRLGLALDDQGAVLDNLGQPSRVIFYTGPLLRARDWEGTAVPELRVAAQRLADRLAGTW